MVGNARSLVPKLESLSDHLHESKVQLAMLTETWLQDGKKLDDFLAKLEHGYSLSMLTRNRTLAANNGRLYRGVAFIYRTVTGKFDPFAFNNPDDHEVLATVGRVYGIKSKIFCLTCCAAPNISILKDRSMIQLISDLVAEAKRVYEHCLIIVAGDFNLWSVNDFLEEHPDMGEVDHGPTREDRCIDRTFVNFSRSVVESGTTDPLETDDGSRKSDHRVAYMEAEFHKGMPKKVSYTYRQYTKDGAADFMRLVSNTDWSKVYNGTDTTRKAAALQGLLDNLMDTCFEWKTTTRDEKEPPWVDDKLRGLWRKRRKIFNGEARSPRWKALKKKSDYRYKTRMRRYMDNLKRNLKSGDASRNFFRLVKALKFREKPPSSTPIARMT